jgi:hypothetical protein
MGDQAGSLDIDTLTALALDVGNALRDFCRKVTTPLLVDRDGEVLPIGTGTFFLFSSAQYVLTAAHVAAKSEGGPVLHCPELDSRFFRTGPFSVEGRPFDLGLARASSARSLRPNALDTECAPVEKELLFTLGYPGSTARRTEPITATNLKRPFFDTFPVEPASFIVQEIDRPEERGFDPSIHIAFKYPDEMRHEAGALRAAPNPGGLSGSLLWDTKRVRAWRNNTPWTPGLARVCGVLLSDFAEDQFIKAVKIEHVRNVLLHLLRRERAYFNWLDRGSIAGDVLGDWLRAVEVLPELSE